MTLRSLLKIQRTPLSAVTAVTPPTRVLAVQPAGGFGDTTTPKSSPTFDVVNGDLLVLQAFSEDSTVTLGTPTWDGTGTWTLQQSVVVSSYCTAYLFTCPVTATATGRTITVTQTGGLTRMWSFIASLWRNHGGLGVTGKANVTGGLPTLTLPVSAGSAVVCGNSDWAAVDGTTRTWNTVNGAAMTEAVYFRSAANYTMYTGYSIDTAGLLGGPETLGLVAPAGQTYAIMGAEIKGTINAGSFSGTSTLPLAATTTSAGTLGKVTGAALAAAATIVAAGVVSMGTGSSLPVTTAITAAGSVSSGLSTTASLASTATITAAGVVGTATGATLASTATLTAAGTVGRVAGSTFTATAALTAGGLIGASAGSSLGSAATLASAGTVGTSTGTTVPITVTFIATGTVTSGIGSGATLTSTASLTATGLIGRSTGGNLSSAATLTAAGRVGTATSITSAITATVSATGTVSQSTGASLTTTATISATGAVGGVYEPLVDPDHMRIVPARNGTRAVVARDYIRTVPARGATRTVEARDGTRTITARPYVRRVP